MRPLAYATFVLSAIILVGCQSAATKPATAPATVPAVDKIDPAKDATYTSGPWQYVYSVSNRGTRSEGYHGNLTHGGLPLPEPAGINDYYVTPWGNLYWVGRPTVLYGGHGWMPKPKVSTPVGRPLPEPAAVKPGEPVVLMMVLADGEASTIRDLALDKWVQDELNAIKATNARVDRDWARLTEQGIMLTSTKLYGVLDVNLAPAAAGDTLTVNIAGSKPMKVQIPRKDGATKLVKHTLTDHLGNELHHYLAFRVERAGK